MRSRDEAWQALDLSFKTLMDSLGQLTEEELTSTPIMDKWTVKDLVAEAWSWADEAIHTVKAWRGPRPWQKGVTFDQAWSEEQMANRSSLPLINVVDGITGAHRRLMHQLELADEEALALTGIAPWGQEMTLLDFFYSIADHYTEHIDTLKEFQSHCLEGCD